MGVFAGPDVSENGLVLALDAANQKSLNIPTQADHGYADWYCLVTGTATYSIISSTGGIIYENNAGTITALVTATGPQRGTITVTAGRTYYGSVPINLVVEDQHQCLAPLTMVGTQFWNIAVRGNPSSYYVYSPYQAATVNFYDATANGLAGTPTSTLSLSAGQSGTFSSNNLTNHWISSNVPIIASVTQIGLDKTILSPMSTYVYQRYQAYLNTTNNTTPTTNNTYVTYDSTYKVMNMTIADGSGGDCAQGLGLEYLSDTYSWGNVVSDYAIVFPYTATVTTSYWSGSAWVVWDTHSNIAGSITNPPRVLRDGNSGPGVEAGTVSGIAANMASGATLWKWEGTAPFYLCINDNADDEFSVLGWLSSRNTSPRSSNVITDITGRGNNGTLTNGPVFTLGNSGSLVFDGVDDRVNLSTAIGIVSQYTISYWARRDAENRMPVSTINGDFYWYGDNSWAYVHGGVAGEYYYSKPTTISLGTWGYYVVVYDGSNVIIYRQGVYQGQQATTGTANFSSALRIGWWSSNTFAYLGNIANVSFYNRVLTAAEVKQNFNATKSRYGL